MYYDNMLLHNVNSNACAAPVVWHARAAVVRARLLALKVVQVPGPLLLLVDACGVCCASTAPVWCVGCRHAN
jgi:hypothetical protein